MQLESQTIENTKHEPHYFVDIEGTVHPWPEPTITTEQIIKLGGWDPSQGVIEIDAHNNEHTLQPGEVVYLKPGHAFAKKVLLQEGLRMTGRVAQEIALLKTRYPNLEYRHEGQWIRIPEYPLPTGWGLSATELAFAIPVEYPGNPPYGIYVPSGLLFHGQRPNNYSDTVPNPPPFGGSWGIFSWTLEDGCWRPAEDLTKGSNLLNWVLGFQQRFREGI